MYMKELADIHKAIAGELHLEHLSEEEQSQVIEAVGTMLYQRVLARVFSELPADQHTKLQQLIEADLENEITALISKYLPNIDEVVNTELTNALAEYKEALASA